ncbi:MAG: hypothetical protein L7U54_01855 [Flavobacteriaceae bacterium]|jgi:uncharacterized BrkB/YihY/UPF0761 family membrane protein|nr:hypothetical protein [Flavobacteriaceae bacterium]
MIYLLYVIFFTCSFIIFNRILKEFYDSFDWFSAALYGLIFLISCALLWIFIFGIYYWIIGEVT